MTDQTAEIGGGKKSLYRYDDYTFKILFPQMLDHVVLHPPIVSYLPWYCLYHVVLHPPIVSYLPWYIVQTLSKTALMVYWLACGRS